MNFARKAPTTPGLGYLKDKIGIETVQDAYTAFAKFLDNDETDVFFGKFGKKYKIETYYGLYAFNPETRNMMFFRKEETGTDTLHSYMNLEKKKAEQLQKNRELFN